MSGKLLDLEASTTSTASDQRPFAFSHRLSDLDLFAFDALLNLAERYATHPRDYFVAASAPWAGTEFYSLPVVSATPCEAMKHLDTSRSRILLKRPENHDQRFRELLDALFDEVVAVRGEALRRDVVRLEATVLISSAAAVTPFHFDPETGFFSQIEGEKMYHVYSPAVLEEPELERFYVRNVVNIGQVKLAGRNPELETTFALRPGRGFHQPQNAPHWVETQDKRSISYTFVFETNATRAAGRARSFNHYSRKLGLSPGAPGSSPGRDAAKAAVMQAALPVRKQVGGFVRDISGRGSAAKRKSIASTSTRSGAG